MADAFNKGLALGLVLSYFLSGPLNTLTSFSMWIVLGIAAYFAFIK